MDSIYHEKGNYFTEVDLATIARKMDEEEKQRMSEGGTNSEEYQNFISAPSSNMDDSGFFSVQVITNALSVWNLESIPYTSRNEIAQQAQADPTTQKAYICNYHEHWFTIRKIGRQWFNLNSLLSGPELISDTYLALFLKQLQQEGYSIFIVIGILPQCTGDQVLTNIMISQKQKPKLLSELAVAGEKIEMLAKESVGMETDDQKHLQDVIQMSLADNQANEDLELELAIALSMSNDAASKEPVASTSSRSIMSEQELEEEQLQRALKISLEQFGNPSSS